MDRVRGRRNHGAEIAIVFREKLHARQHAIELLPLLIDHNLQNRELGAQLAVTDRRLIARER